MRAAARTSPSRRNAGAAVLNDDDDDDDDDDDSDGHNHRNHRHHHHHHQSPPRQQHTQDKAGELFCIRIHIDAFFSVATRSGGSSTKRRVEPLCVIYQVQQHL
jgi:hypothetical protein